MKKIFLFIFLFITCVNLHSQTSREMFAVKDKLRSDTEPVEYYVTSHFFSGNHQIILYTYVKAFYMTDLKWLEENHKHYRQDYDGHKLKNTSIVLATNFKKWKRDQTNADFVEKLHLDYARYGNLDTVDFKRIQCPYYSNCDSIHPETVKFTNGDVYMGDMIYSIKHGKGKYTWADSSYYDGDWWHDKRTGQGKFAFNANEYYVGGFDNGIFMGKGKYYYSNGDVFDGFYVDGIKNGSGLHTFADGSIKKGIWNNGDYVQGSESKYNPNEKFIPPYKPTLLSADKYEGAMKNGKRNGMGKYYFKNGQIYDGNFKDDMYNGKGKFIFTDGSWCEGDWIDNQKSGQFKYYSANGTLTFDGLYVNDQRNGYGKSYYDNGATYFGEFKDGVKSGQGKYTFSDGNYYDGEWLNDKYHGIGGYYNKNGVGTKCRYVENKCVEEIK